MIISLQRGARKAEFRVEWIKQLAPNEFQAGIESLEPQNNFWGVDLSGDVDIKKDGETLMSLSWPAPQKLSCDPPSRLRDAQPLMSR